MTSMIGKRFLEVFPHLKEDPYSRAEAIEKVAFGEKLQGESSFFSHLWNGWIQLIVIKLGDGKFIALYIDIAELRHHLDKLIKIIASFEGILLKNGDIDYRYIADNLRELADAKFAVLNILEDAGQKSRIVAISTDKETHDIAEDFFDEQITEEAWKESSPTGITSDDVLTKVFASLSEVAEEEDFKKTLEAFEIKADLGETIVAKINVREKTSGYLLLSIPKGKQYRNQSIVDIYNRFIGLAIALKEDETKIREEKNQFESLFENMGSGATVLEVANLGQTSEDYIIKDMNKVGLELSNVTKRAIVGKTMRDLNEDFDRTGLIRCLKKAWETGKNAHTIINIKSHDRKLKWYESRTFVLPNKSLVTIYDDVTDRVEAEQALAKSEITLKKLIDNMEQGLAVSEIIMDKDGVPSNCSFLMVNPSFEKLTGLKRTEILGKTFKDAVPGFETYWVERFARVALTGESVEFDEYSDILDKHFHVVAYRPFEGVVTIILTDITEQKLIEEQLRLRGDQDSLTGLFNRRYFDEELARQDYEGNYPLTLILADIDDMKMINDAYGHQEGDKAIQQIAALIKEVCPDDCVIARTGGDEFALLLIRQNEAQADVLTQRIRKAADKIFLFQKPLSLSMGFATKNGPHQRIGDVFRQAENMIYKNKVLWNRSAIGTVDMIMQTLREKSPRERIHADQVALVCKEIGEEMGLSEDSSQELITAAQLHDIGKIGIAERILDKPDKLTKEEYQIIKRHCESGYKILTPIAELESVAVTILTHHERFDGNGYPNGLSGDTIPIHARIISVADTFSAMISDRPYRDKLGWEEAKQEIIRCSGTQFDPIVVDLFLKRFSHIVSKIQNI